ncbi:MAG: PilW family protein [Zoogloeaceae bacterium]|jgi:type IV pilus assembly protein PilW|nr:PilW family protein [Zoogloeaceae bacterium]
MHPDYPGQTGFTLVELMVGMAIGLFLTLIITQTMSIFETRGSATIGNADAQTNGGIALYTVGRDMQMAGFALLPDVDSPLECTSLDSGIATMAEIAPALITDGAAGGSDTLVVRYGVSATGGAFTKITDPPTGSGDATVANNLACQPNDIALIVNGTSCYLRTVTGPGDLGVNAVSFTALQLDDATPALPGANLACIRSWHQITYSVQDGNLWRKDERIEGGAPQTSDTPILSGIVSLQAQYGISAIATSNQITQWVNASAAPWNAPSLADRNRIKAVRLAVIARNDKIDPQDVTTACSSLTAAAPTGLCAWAGDATSPAPTVSLGGADWQRYRYRVFETIFPLRNVIWSKETL